MCKRWRISKHQELEIGIQFEHKLLCGNNIFKHGPSSPKKNAEKFEGAWQPQEILTQITSSHIHNDI